MPKIDPKKFKLLVGLGLIVLAFLGTCSIFYIMNNTNMRHEEKIKSLSDDVSQLNSEKNITEIELENLKVQGDSIKVDKLVAQAQKEYDPKELNRKEGILWVDRQSQTFLVTLGALHGLKPGSSLTIYDNESKVGIVTVDTPLDVVSYVWPLEKDKDKFASNYYRAVIE